MALRQRDVEPVDCQTLARIPDEIAIDVLKVDGRACEAIHRTGRAGTRGRCKRGLQSGAVGQPCRNTGGHASRTYFQVRARNRANVRGHQSAYRRSCATRQPTTLQCRCSVSAWFRCPESVKFSPVKEASPVETGNGRPDCSVLIMPNVQLFRMARATGTSEEIVRVGYKVEVDQVTDIILSGGIVQRERRKWIPGFRKAEEVLSVRQSMGPHVVALELNMARHPLHRRDHKRVVPRLAIAEDRLG